MVFIENTITRIKSYVKIINKTISDEELLDFSINEVVNRTQLYLNRDDIPEPLERMLASIVNSVFKTYTNTESNNIISSISDNGQSISYSNEITNYFITTNDKELFSGFSSLLNRYRRITVVTPKKL